MCVNAGLNIFGEGIVELRGGIDVLLSWKQKLELFEQKVDELDRPMEVTRRVMGILDSQIEC